MSQLGSLPPGLPIPPRTEAGMVTWAAHLIQSLAQAFRGIFFDLSQQPRCPEFLAAGLPPAADWRGRIIFVTDGGAGAEFRASNGSAWVNLG